MSKPDESALVAAAAAFDEELIIYNRLGELFLRAPVDTIKHVERAKATLNELAQSEERLQTAAQRMLAAIGAARERQESLAKRVVEHAPALQARNASVNGLVAQLHDIAAEVATLNEHVTGPQPADVPAVADRVLALSTRAEQLAVEARTAELDELAEQAHALQQRLRAVAKKLGRA
jgi:hypothetical protein